MSKFDSFPLMGHAPDLDPAQPGVFSYCKGMEASAAGWQLQRSLLAASASTTGDPADGFIFHYPVNNIGFLYVVQGTNVYNGLGNVVGTATNANYFSFCQYGVNIFMAQYNVGTGLPLNVQTKDGTNAITTFANSSATGIPKAAICVTWGPPTSPRVMLLNYDDGTSTPDGFWTSHQGGPTLAWTPDIATGAANGRLIGIGRITCGIAYNDDIIAFGPKSMWRGIYIGPPYTVQWQRISEDIGCIGPGAATVVNGILYFLNERGLFQYDGTYPRKVQVPIQGELGNYLTGLGTAYARSKVVSDGGGQRLVVVIRRDGAGPALTAATKVYLINLLNNKVGIDGRGSWLVLDEGWYVSPSGGIQQESRQTVSGNGTPYAASLADLFGFGMNRIGSNKVDMKGLRIIPRFATAPTTYSCTPYYGPTASEALGASLTPITVSATPWRAAFTHNARWFAPRLYFSSNGTTDVEVLEVGMEETAGGTQ